MRKKLANKKFYRSGTIYEAFSSHVKRSNTYSPLRNGITMFFLAIFSFIILIGAVRGLPGTPTSKEVNTPKWRDNGPFELSPERGRYALLYALVEDKTPNFSQDLATFTAPDNAVTKDGKFASLFAPGPSFFMIPGYVIGRYFNLAQVGATMVIALFAILNMLLIRAIAIRLGSHPTAASIAGIVFGFASPAFTYAVSLYQHHISTFLILLCVYTLLRFRGIWSLSLIWFLCALGIAVDYPNFFMMLPIGIFALGRFIVIDKAARTYNIKLKLYGLITFFGAVIPLVFFLTYNQIAYNNPFQLSGTLPTVAQVQLAKQSTLDKTVGKGTTGTVQINKESIGVFHSRGLLLGFYEFFLSMDRSMTIYTPVVLFGIVGIILALRKNKPIYLLLLGITSMNILLYAMWEDPYGGWAFGARYLVPSYAVLSIFIAAALTRFRQRNGFLLLFYVVFAYSIAVNTLGAITTSQNPPAVEAEALALVTHKYEPVTPERNYIYLMEKGSKSFFYQVVAHTYIDQFDYYLLLTAILLSTGGLMLMYLRVFAREGEAYES